MVILEHHASAPVRKKRLILLNKARREATRNKLVKANGMPDRVKSFREVNSSKDHPRAWLGLVKSIRNGLRTIKNLIKSKQTRAKTGLVRREREVRLHKVEEIK